MTIPPPSVGAGVYDAAASPLRSSLRRPFIRPATAYSAWADRSRSIEGARLMASYFVPYLGPSIYMNAATEAWAERIGKRIERKEYADLDAARAFARNILSRVEDEKGNAISDSQPSGPAAPCR